MSAPVAALIIRPDGTAEIRDVAPDLATLQGLVGGFLEAVSPDDGPNSDWHAYVNEEARITGEPVNEAGTLFAIRCGWMTSAEDHPLLRGPIVFLGSTENGDEADVPPEVVGEAVRLWGLDA